MTKTCNICNKEFKNLGSHLKKHAVKGDTIITPKIADIVPEIKDDKDFFGEAKHPISEGVEITEETKPVLPDTALPVAEIQADITLTDEAVSTQPEPVTNVNNCEYHLIMEFNNKKYECYTNNLKIGILSLKPHEVLTEMFITIKKGSAEFIKKLTLIQARQLLNDNQNLDIFLDTFYSLYGQPSNTQR